MEPTVAAARRLGVGHLLVWMVGCGVVLAIFRTMPDFSQMTEEQAFTIRLQHLGVGLGYGTAITGLGLLVWWRWRGVQLAPTQPGHWMLALGGIALVINLLVASIAHWLAPLLHRAGIGVVEWSLFNALGWAGGSVLGLVLLPQVRGLLRLRIVAWLMLVILLVNAVTYGVSLTAQIRAIPGMWHWWAPFYTRLAGEAIGVLAIVAADVADQLQRQPRDWLHIAGVASLVAMACVDLAVTTRALFLV